MKSEATRGDLQSPTASYQRKLRATPRLLALHQCPPRHPLLPFWMEPVPGKGADAVIRCDSRNGTAIFAEVTPLDAIHTPLLCSVLFAPGPPCCLLLPNPTVLGSEMPSQICPSPDLVSTPSSGSPSWCPATGVRLLTGFCQGPGCRVPGAGDRLLSAPWVVEGSLDSSPEIFTQRLEILVHSSSLLLVWHLQTTFLWNCNCPCDICSLTVARCVLAFSCSWPERCCSRQISPQGLAATPNSCPLPTPPSPAQLCSSSGLAGLVYARSALPRCSPRYRYQPS